MDIEVFEFFTALAEKVAGISYNEGKKYLVERRLKELALSLGYKDFNSFYQSIIKKGIDSKLLEEIIDSLLTNETYFFRDYYPFEAIRMHILPELFKKREKEKKISIWSSACSTGQEVYSIAMILKEYFPFYLEKYQIYLLGSDISVSALEKAKKGVYNQVEINRGLPAHFLVKYFTQSGAHWFINEDIKKLVQFKKINLIEISKTLFEKFDLILCRYVLIYFSEDVKKQVLTNIWKLLNPGGYLILGATEIPVITFPDMEKILINKAVCYYKKD